MGTNKLLAAASGLIAGALLFSACTPPTPSANPTATQSAISEKTTVSVMWNQALYSGNGQTGFGNATANNNILYLTNDTVTYYDQDLNLVNNKSFGTYEKVSDAPLTVKQTVADTATWSDGVPVTPADYVLSYGAQSGLFNNYEAKLDEETGDVGGANKDGKVFFNSSSAAWALIKDFPVVDGKTVTYTYTKPFADWEKNLFGATAVLPAHIIGKRALGIDDPTQAAQAVLDAFKNKDNSALSKISNSWNADWNYAEMPADKELVVGTGPYTMTEFVKGSYLTLSKNANYKGEHVPSIDTITVRFNEDPQAAVQALQNGEVQLISPQSTQDILKQLQAVQGVKVLTGDEGTFEHVDLVFNNGGPFDPKTYGGDAEKALKVRQAFLLTLPRQQIIDTIIKPLNPEAAIRNSFTVVPGSPNYAGVTAANGMSAYDQVDLEKAKALLKEAGVTSPTVRVLYAKPHPRRVQQFQLIKESAEQAGFKIVDGGDANWGQKLTGTSKYDASMFGWQSTSTAVTESDANYRTDSIPNNFGGYSSKAVDGILDELQVATDPAKQAELVAQMEKQLMDDAFGVSIYQFPSITSYSEKLAGVAPITIAPTIFWNFWEWKI
ncbi:MAG TPA: ABC transporter family substrate-binding protein [Propionicimonas sp.]|nr:ABC transporter family substrate-binding protein [Propionicimonas sp.]